jgi:hypothetical protein
MCLLQSGLIEQNCLHVWRCESWTNVERSSFNSVGFASSDQSRQRVLPSILVRSKNLSTLSNFEISSNLHQHLSMKEGSLFCFVGMRSTEPGCFRSRSWCLWKALDEEGWMGLVPWYLDLRCKSFWILNIFSLKIKLNRSWKFRRNWNVPLVLLERSWWAGFNEIYLVRFGFRMWERLIFKWFLWLKIQINSKKPGFGTKNQLRTW